MRNSDLLKNVSWIILCYNLKSTFKSKRDQKGKEICSGIYLIQKMPAKNCMILA